MRPTSIAQFKAHMEETPQHLSLTYHSRQGIPEAQAALQAAKRIFFSGSGSSLPAALIGQQLLIQRTTKASIFAPSSLLLDGAQLTEGDVVILVSQGWNRADAALTTQRILKTKAQLIVVTGRPERLELYKELAATSKLIIIPIFPAVEKIFCRPATAVTGYSKVVQLLEPLTGLQFTEQQWLTAYQTGANYPVHSLSPTAQYVVLASSQLLCAGHNIALSLREGAGRFGCLYEIESYGHGQYVPDQRNVQQTHYIILTGPAGTYGQAAFQRLQPMLDSTRSRYEIWSSELDPVLANVSFMAHTARLIYHEIVQSHWDMNNPPGMEGNRSFHEVMI